MRASRQTAKERWIDREGGMEDRERDKQTETNRDRQTDRDGDGD